MLNGTPKNVSALRWSYFDPLGKPAAFPSSFSDLSMWIARVEGSGDAPLFAGEYGFSKREKKTSREAVGASADDDAMTSSSHAYLVTQSSPRTTVVLEHCCRHHSALAQLGDVHGREVRERPFEGLDLGRKTREHLLFLEHVK